MVTAAFRSTAVGEISNAVERCRRGFQNNLVRTISQRKHVLRQFVKFLNEHEEGLCEACTADLRKHPFETKVTEIAMARNEAISGIDSLESWMKPTKAHLEGIQLIEDCVIQRDPKGVILIIGAWNYPVQLTLVGAIGAVTAGNTVVLKPSEVSPHVAQYLADHLNDYVPREICAVVNGAIPETTTLLEQRFDHIMYTGNDRVARIVMAAAAKNLTPVTLELGGKSPTIVDDTCGDLNVVAQRILWGRTVNAGQTCIAPDYILVKPNVKAALIEAIKKARVKFLGDDPKASASYARIVNDMHFKRVTALMKGGKVVVGGETDPATRFIAPTVLDDVDLTHPLMTDEIFGPLLPLVPYNTMQEAIDFINTREKPLALYIFSGDSKFVNTITEMTSSGAVVVNDTLMHAGVEGLPFGGVGNSGMGAYHGKHTFDEFTHKKSVMRRKLSLEVANELRYPPYTDQKLGWISFLLFKTSESKPWKKYVALCAVAAIAAAIVLGVGFGTKKF
ncbi:aldehyde dehydrogenase, putative [Bodo saltans]|uniref:Aldehyde dehydrogenase n=1 Tax=Bodo saltans TaxID=75058 RepID=A0A0S4JSD7_BODSA|nr:aldehyde dehydrogenase, putative [Bodo saltans]|eukprot:CUG94432.1 aldehyde dehydrogenase, putative [Bodo saltans]